jgi:hypothetical protein
MGAPTGCQLRTSRVISVGLSGKRVRPRPAPLTVLCVLLGLWAGVRFTVS